MKAVMAGATPASCRTIEKAGRADLEATAMALNLKAHERADQSAINERSMNGVDVPARRIQSRPSGIPRRAAPSIFILRVIRRRPASISARREESQPADSWRGRSAILDCVQAHYRPGAEKPSSYFSNTERIRNRHAAAPD